MSFFSIKISLLLFLPYIFCNLTDFEKDRYLTCGEFVNLIRTYDKDEIRQTLTQQEHLFIGVNALISVDMMINCLHNINDTLVKMMYVNMERVMNETEIDDSEIEFIRVNYSDYANITEFMFDDEKANVTITLREVYNEYTSLHSPHETERKNNNYTNETLSEDDQKDYEEREIDFNKLNNQKEESKEPNEQIKGTKNKPENNNKKKENEKQQENKEKNEDL